MRRGLEKESPRNPTKETPAGQLANVWDNNSKRIKINCEKEKAEGKKSRLHTILYIVGKIMHICGNHLP